MMHRGGKNNLGNLKRHFECHHAGSHHGVAFFYGNGIVQALHGHVKVLNGRARGGLWADRIMVPPFSKLAVEGGHGTVEDLERAAAAWREWAAHRDAWFVMVQGEVICRVT